jgi:hypothetical protein
MIPLLLLKNLRILPLRFSLLPTKVYLADFACVWVPASYNDSNDSTWQQIERHIIVATGKSQE